MQWKNQGQIFRKELSTYPATATNKDNCTDPIEKLMPE
jgi:hypothetical protein